MTTTAITTTPQDSDRQAIVGATADQFARAGVFQNYQAWRAYNTLRCQQDDLATFAVYLAAVKFYEDAYGHSERVY